MKDWKRVHGSQAEKPAEFDSVSSPVVVYQRRNIKRIETEDSELWEYEERTMSHEEYAVMSEIAKTQKDIAAIEDVLCALDSVNSI